MSLLAKSFLRSGAIGRRFAPALPCNHQAVVGFIAPRKQDPQLIHRSLHVTQPRLNAAGSHGAHWVAERAVSVALLGVLPAAYFVQNPTMDFLLTTSVVLHCHWGIAAIFNDYMHGYPSETGERRHPFLSTLGVAIPYILSIIAYACLLNFNYNDVGLIHAIKMLWRI